MRLVPEPHPSPRSTIHRLLSPPAVVVFFFSLAVMLGPAVATLFAYDLSQTRDAAFYLGLAHFDLQQSPIARYRVLIPFAAAALSWLFGDLFKRLAPGYFAGDFPLAFSFFLINVTLMAVFGVLVYRYCRAYGASVAAAVVGLLIVLTSRYTAYFAALPLVDSLFCVVVALALVGIKEKNTQLVVWAIFLGPFAKESFIFVAPVIFFFSHIPKGRQVVLFALSGALVFGFRYLLDLYAGNADSALALDIRHVRLVTPSVVKLLSLYGLYKVVAPFGLWLLIPIVGALALRGYGQQLKTLLDGCPFWLLISVLVQMLLSGSFERMAYLAMPVMGVVAAVTVDELKRWVAVETPLTEPRRFTS